MILVKRKRIVRHKDYGGYLMRYNDMIELGISIDIDDRGVNRLERLKRGGLGVNLINWPHQPVDNL